MGHSVAAKVGVGLVHVAHDDRDMLEPMVVAAAVDRDRPPFGRQEIDELDVLLPKAQPNNSGAHSEHAEQARVILSGDLDVRDNLERQHLSVEWKRTLHIAYGNGDGFDALGDLRRGRAARNSAES